MKARISGCLRLPEAFKLGDKKAEHEYSSLSVKDELWIRGKQEETTVRIYVLWPSIKHTLTTTLKPVKNVVGRPGLDEQEAESRNQEDSTKTHSKFLPRETSLKCLRSKQAWQSKWLLQCPLNLQYVSLAIQSEEPIVKRRRQEGGAFPTFVSLRFRDEGDLLLLTVNGC